MAIEADFQNHDRHVTLDLYVDDDRLRVTDDPLVPGYTLNADIDIYWDGEKLESGEYEFVGIEIRDIRSLDDEDLRAIAFLNLPRVDVPVLHCSDAKISEILQHARDQALSATR